jgi:LCP family protein required for cell wall assembly
LEVFMDYRQDDNSPENGHGQVSHGSHRRTARADTQRATRDNSRRGVTREAKWGVQEEGGETADWSSRRGQKRQQQKKRFRTWHKVALGVGVPVLVLLLIAGIALFSFVRATDARMAIDPLEREDLQQSLAPRAADPQEPYYVLVLGSDARTGQTVSRSDTIMLCRVDSEKKAVSILSIPRDTKVELKGYGTQKINAAMAYGGPAGAVTAVSDFVGVNISHVVMIDFDNFAGIVDTLGGVTVNVPFYTSYGGIELQEGTQTLNGEQALAFVRCRKDYALGDFQRAANQRALLKAVAKKVTQAPANEIPGLVGSLADSLNTDLTSMQLVDIALAFQGTDLDAIMSTGQVPATTGTIDGISYVLTREDEWAAVREKYRDGVTPFVDADNQPSVVE